MPHQADGYEGTHEARQAEVHAVERADLDQVLNHLRTQSASLTTSGKSESRRTSFISASLTGNGTCPGSSVIARKKLYVHTSAKMAKKRFVMACPVVPIGPKGQLRVFFPNMATWQRPFAPFMKRVSQT